MNNSKYSNFTAGKNDAGKRIDKIIRKFLPDLSLKAIYKLLRTGDIRINEKKIKPEYRVSEGDTIHIFTPLLGERGEKKKSSGPGLDTNSIVFENTHILIVNKPAGLLVHGGKESLEERVRVYLNDKTPDSLTFTPGPLHRLDRNTSGLITFSASLEGAREFSSLVQNHKLEKSYLALVDGTFTEREIWIDNLARDEKKRLTYACDTGKRAESLFIPLGSSKNKTLALIHIKTGRTHQIRCQSALHGKPLTGDVKYSGSGQQEGYFLSACGLKLKEKNALLGFEKIKIPLFYKKAELIKKYFTESRMESLYNKFCRLWEEQ